MAKKQLGQPAKAAKMAPPGARGGQNPSRSAPSLKGSGPVNNPPISRGSRSGGGQAPGKAGPSIKQGPANRPPKAR